MLYYKSHKNKENYGCIQVLRANKLLVLNS